MKQRRRSRRTLRPVARSEIAAGRRAFVSERNAKRPRKMKSTRLFALFLAGVAETYALRSHAAIEGVIPIESYESALYDVKEEIDVLDANYFVRRTILGRRQQDLEEQLSIRSDMGKECDDWARSVCDSSACQRRAPLCVRCKFCEKVRSNSGPAARPRPVVGDVLHQSF